jgi:2-polyprenyl-3-methyl-5-hydroxy-6-metoxy-1,4-benzoquinol methylase
VSIRILPLSQVSLSERAALQGRLNDYYSHPPRTYYAIADHGPELYRSDLRPFHCDLVSRAEKGMNILEVGCGTAHLCPHMEAAGGTYTGVDYSDELLAANRAKHPRARFLAVGQRLDEKFDIVASLYAIEHVTDPLSYLEALWSYCKPQGLLAIICPEFIDNDDLAPSIYYGKTPRRIRHKIRALALGDAFRHCFDLLWVARRWKKRAQQSAAGAFWLNLRPRALTAAEYSIDTDAVHLSGLRDLVWWFEQRPATILTTSHCLQGIDPQILRYNSYIVARREAV